jgi:hypothetical protein
MSAGSEPKHLSSNHRDTLAQLFRHPVSQNVEWRAAVALLEQVGHVTERHDGKFEIKAGTNTLIMSRPRAKDLDAQQVVDLRKLLEQAGYAPEP